jgi:methylmalonyl-CoA epimerase
MSIELDRIDHVGVAVADMEAAIALYEGKLGMPLVHRETIAEHGIDAALLEVGDGHVELLFPIEEDTSVGRFIARQGQGLHHVAYAVENIEAALADLANEGLELIDAEPRVGIRNSRAAFVHHDSVTGVLTELVEPASG